MREKITIKHYTVFAERSPWIVDVTKLEASFLY
jgi:hypothetical protein